MSTNEAYLQGLAEEYYDRREAHDKVVCTKIRKKDGEHIPANEDEMLAMIRNSRRIERELRDRAFKYMGVAPAEVTAAIDRCGRNK